MYSCLGKFLGNAGMIYDLQLGFRQKHSTSQAVVHLTNETR